MAEPVEALSIALRNSSRWVRMGAIASAPRIAPGAAAGLLRQIAAITNIDAAPEEAAAIALALTSAGLGSREEAFPIICKLLDDTPDLARNALQSRSGVTWAEHIKVQADQGKVSAAVGRLLTPFWARWHSSERQPENHPWTDEERATSAVSSLEHVWEAYHGRPLRVPFASALGAAVRELQDGNYHDGANRLAEAALTEPDEHTRYIIRQILPRMGSTAASTLAAALAGQPSVLPTEDVFVSVAREEPSVEIEATPQALGEYLAAMALRDFSDESTVRTIASGAITWRGAPQARATNVLANMSSAASLPYLAWAASQLPEQIDRRAASELLQRIVERDPALGIYSNHVANVEIPPNSLDWLLSIPDNQDWMEDPNIAVPLLRRAIETIPIVVGDSGRSYKLGGGSSSYFRTISGWLGLNAHSERAENLPRYPLASFPAHCRKGERAELHVRLLPRAASGTLAPFDVPFAAGKEQTKLTVLAWAPGFEVSEPYGILEVPREGPSNTAVFNLRAREDGTQIVQITFLHGTVEIGQCYLSTEVGETSSTDIARTKSLDAVTEASFTRRGGARAVLIVQTNDGYLSWQILEGEGPPRPLGISPTQFNPALVAGWLAKQTAIVHKVLAANLSKKQLEGVLANLRGIGADLFRQVAPESLAHHLSKLPDHAIVRIESDAQWVPWELLAPPSADRLLGDRFVIVRGPRIDKLPKRAICVPPNSVSTISEAALVIGDKVNQPLKLAENLFGEFANRANPRLLETDWPELCKGVRSKDIVHFACHGRTNELGYHLSYGAQPGSQLVPGQVAELDLKPGAVVFANACSSGTSTLALAEFQDFGRAFYLIGARPFIGTLGPVPEDDAMVFATLFYRYFAAEGLPAGHAMRLARLDAAKTLKTPTWLFYCMYGDTAVSRRWSPVDKS